MFGKFRFYIKHSLNDLRVNGQRTFFGLFAIAAGVAAIVSLMTLGVMIQDTLTGSLQESNRGDITINNYYITPRDLERIQRSLDEMDIEGYTITTRQDMEGDPTEDTNSGIVVSRIDGSAINPFTVPFIVDTRVYPFYGQIHSEDGQSLEELLRLESYTDPSYETADIVISRNLADRLDADVGDVLRLNNTSKDFTVRGIVSIYTEGGFENLLAGLMGYYYLDHSALPLFENRIPVYNRVHIRLDNPQADLTTAERGLDFGGFDATTTEELREQNVLISDALNQFVSIMGLLAMLIGGIGVINTMLVVVQRRTREIAILKTIGLEPSQVTLLLLVEAGIMGILGSILGILIGLFGAYALQSFAEVAVAQNLTFRIAPSPIITGLIVGTVVTTIFGFLPTLAGGMVRPAMVLRPNETIIPRAGRLRSFTAVLAVIFAVSLVAQGMVGGLVDDENLEQLKFFAGISGAIIGVLMMLAMFIGGIWSGWTNRRILLRILRWLLLLTIPAIGFAFGYMIEATLFLTVTFITVTILYGVVWFIVWLIGRFFPTFNIVDFKVAMRGLLAAKGRSASGVLALIVGVFTLSLMTMLVTTIKDAFEQSLIQDTGGDLLVFSPLQSAELMESTGEQVRAIDGVNGYGIVESYWVTITTIIDGETGNRRTSNSYRNSTQLSARTPDQALPTRSMYAGRQLNADDAGQAVIVIPWDEFTSSIGVEVGDQVTVQFEGPGSTESRTMTYEVIGMVDRMGGLNVEFAGEYYVPLGTTPPSSQPNQLLSIVDVDDNAIPQVNRTLLAVPGMFVLEVRLLNDLVNRLLNQFTVFPLLVAVLTLTAGGIVIANSVALSTMERRKDIAVMKAVGLQRERVLGMLLLENALLGIIGGLIGVGIASLLLLLILVQMFQGEIGTQIPVGTALLLMMMCIGISLFAAILSVWGASGEKPLNVLRYE